MWRSYILVVLRACSEMRQQLALEVVQPVLFCFAFFFFLCLFIQCAQLLAEMLVLPHLVFWLHFLER